MSAALRTAIDARYTAIKEVELVLKRDYPVGAEIAWHLHGHVRRGAVSRHGYGDRIKVFNRGTGGEYWIYAKRIVSP